MKTADHTNLERAYPFSQMLKLGARFFEQLLFPSKCLKCGIYLNPEVPADKLLQESFCDSCFGKGTCVIAPPFCTMCGKVFESGSGGDHVCESCIRQPLFVKKVRGCLSYEGVVREAVPLVKYGAKLSLLKVLEPVMAQGFYLYFGYHDIDLVMPVPLHRKKVIKRGFNQSYLLVRNLKKHVAKKTGKNPSWQLDLFSLKRVKMTASQTGFDVKNRRKNLKNAFRVVRKDRIKDKHILLVDDV